MMTKKIEGVGLCVNKQPKVAYLAQKKYVGVLNNE
jgi:hypothetical protein